MTPLFDDLHCLPFVALESAGGSQGPAVPSPPAVSSAALLSADADGADGSAPRSAVAALTSSRLRSIVSGARQAHGPHRVRWSLRERLAWQELVVTRGEGA